MINSPKHIEFIQYPVYSGANVRRSLIGTDINVEVDPIMHVSQNAVNPYNLNNNQPLFTFLYDQSNPHLPKSHRAYTSNTLYQTHEVNRNGLIGYETFFSHIFHTSLTQQGGNITRGAHSLAKFTIQFINISSVYYPSFVLRVIARIRYTHQASISGGITLPSWDIQSGAKDVIAPDPIPEGINAFSLFHSGGDTNPGTFGTFPFLSVLRGGATQFGSANDAGEIEVGYPIYIRNLFFSTDHYFIKTFAEFV